MSRAAETTKKFRGWRLALTIVLAFVAATAAEVAWQYNYPTAHAAANFTLNDRLIRASQPEAQQILADIYETKTLVLINDQLDEYETSLAELGAKVNTANQIEALFNYPTWQRLVPYSYWLNFFNAGPLPAPSIEVGEIALEPTAAHEAIILNEEGNLQVLPSSDGFSFDKLQLAQLLRQLEVNCEDSQSVRFSFALPQPPISTAQAQQLVNTVLQNSQEGVAVLYEGQSAVIPQASVLSWLSFYAGDDTTTISLSLNEQEVRNFVSSAQLSLPAATATNTIINYVDGVETSRTQGRAGTAINFAGLTSAIVASLQDRAQAVTISMIELKPKTEYVDTYTSEFIRRSVEERMSAFGGTFVDINLSTQHLTYVKDFHIVLDSAIVSGRPSMPTPPGTYRLLGKATGVTLVGADYRTWVAYWMPFIGNAYGMHDATWQSSFGGTRYKSGYGSHGCVNMPKSAAAELYNVISVGDVVYVHW